MYDTITIHCNRNDFGLRSQKRMKKRGEKEIQQRKTSALDGPNLTLNAALINNELDFLGLSNATAHGCAPCTPDSCANIY